MQPNNSQITHQSIFYYYMCGDETKDHHFYHLLAQSGTRWQEQDKDEPLSKWFQGLSHSVFDLWPKYATFVCSPACAYDTRCLIYLWSVFYPNRENGPLCRMYASQRERHFISAATPQLHPFSLPTTYMELDWAVQVYTDKLHQSDLAVDKEREKGSPCLFWFLFWLE